MSSSDTVRQLMQAAGLLSEGHEQERVENNFSQDEALHYMRLKRTKDLVSNVILL